MLKHDLSSINVLLIYMGAIYDNRFDVFGIAIPGWAIATQPIHIMQTHVRLAHEGCEIGKHYPAIRTRPAGLIISY